MPNKLNGWLVAAQGPNDPHQQLYAAVAERVKYSSIADEKAHAEALVGDYLLVTNERIEFRRRLTDGEIARLGLKAGEVKQIG